MQIDKDCNWEADKLKTNIDDFLLSVKAPIEALADKDK